MEGSHDDASSQAIEAEKPLPTHRSQSGEPITDVECSPDARLTEELERCDWNQLQDKYADALDEHSRIEAELRMEITKLLEVSTQLNAGIEIFSLICASYSPRGPKQSCCKTRCGP